MGKHSCPKSEAIPDSHRLPQAVYPSLNDMSSPTQDYLGFIFSVGDAIKGLKIRDESKQNLAPVQGLIDVLKTLTLWIEEIPPLQQEQRFGNKAFRDWYTKLQKVRIQITQISILLWGSQLFFNSFCSRRQLLCSTKHFPTSRFPIENPA